MEISSEARSVIGNFDCRQIERDFNARNISHRENSINTLNFLMSANDYLLDSQMEICDQKSFKLKYSSVKGSSQAIEATIKLELGGWCCSDVMRCTLKPISQTPNTVNAVVMELVIREGGPRTIEQAARAGDGDIPHKKGQRNVSEVRVSETEEHKDKACLSQQEFEERLKQQDEELIEMNRRKNDRVIVEHHNDDDYAYFASPREGGCEKEVKHEKLTQAGESVQENEYQNIYKIEDDEEEDLPNRIPDSSKS